MVGIYFNLFLLLLIFNFSDDSLGYEFPFTLKAVLQGGQICAICHWTQFCRGCDLPCDDQCIFDICKGAQNNMCIAIDWDPTALHLRYQSSREKVTLRYYVLLQYLFFMLLVMDRTWIGGNVQEIAYRTDRFGLLFEGIYVGGTFRGEVSLFKLSG